MPANPLDVLAQQVVAATALDAWDVDDLFDLVRRARAVRRSCPAVGATTRRSTCSPAATRATSSPSCGPRIVWDRVTGTLTGRPGAQRLAVTSGGTIPDRGLFGVFLVGGEGPGRRVGELDEEMVYESRVGDVFALGATSWRIEDITHDRVLVTPAPGHARPAAVLEGRHPRPPGRARRGDRRVHPRARRAAREAKADRAGPRRTASTSAPPTTWSRYLARAASRPPTSLPSDTHAVVERFRDELGDWRLVVHSPYGTPVHAPVGAGDQRPAARALRRRRPGDGHRRRHRDPDPRDRRRAARRRARSSSSPTRSSDLSPARSAARRCSPPGSASAPPGRCCCPAATPAAARPLWQQRQRSAAAARGGRQVPVVPDRARDGPRVPPGRLRPARAGRR